MSASEYLAKAKEALIRREVYLFEVEQMRKMRLVPPPRLEEFIRRADEQTREVTMYATLAYAEKLLEDK